MRKILFLSTAGALSLFTQQAALGDSLIDANWVAWDQLPDAEKTQIAPYCPGGFISQPLQPATDNTRFYFNSADITTDQTIHATGDVKIVADGINTHADQLQFNQSTQQGRLTGHVALTLDNVMLGANSADISLSNNRTQLNDASFILPEQDFHGAAEQLERANNQNYFAKNVQLTRCAPSTLGWRMKAARLEIDEQTDIAYLWHPRLEIANVPVLYSPYLSFPLNDQPRTGLLIPSFGTGFSQQYYLHLAPNYDDTVGLEYNRDQGYFLHNEFRFLTNNHNGISDVSIGIGNNPTAANTDKRWAFAHRQSGLLTKNIGYDFSTRWVSDSNYDLDVVSGKNELVKSQLAQLTLKAKPWESDLTVSANYAEPVNDSSEKMQQLELNTQIKKAGHTLAAEYQTQQPAKQTTNPVAADYQLLKVPDVRLTPKALTLPFHTQLNSQFRYSLFSRNLPQSQLTSLSDNQLNLATQSQRIHVSTALTKQWQSNLGYIKPTLEVMANQYQYSNDTDADNLPSQTHLAWRASFDQALTLQTRQNNWQHRLTPRLYYAYSPLTEQPATQLDTKAVTAFKLFTASRFDGVDRVGDLSRLSTSLKYSLAEQTSQQDRLELSLNKGVKLAQERLGLTTVNDVDPNWQAEYSTWNLSGTLTPNEHWTFSASSEHQHESLAVDTYALNTHYQPSKRVFIDVNLKKTADLETFSLGGYYPVHDQLAVIALAETEAKYSEKLFDWSAQETKRWLLGLDYDTCCWNARVAVLETAAAEDDEGTSIFLDQSNFEIKFELTLKGIGASAGNIEDTLNNLDFGYSGKLFNYR